MNQKDKSGYGKLKFGKDNKPIQKVLIFLETHLPEFIFLFTNSLLKEEGLTQELYAILVDKATKSKFPFKFIQDYRENTEKGNSTRVDLGVLGDDTIIHSITYPRNKSFFSIEAKILGTDEKSREKEYVVGRWKNEKGKQKYDESGGMERFKKSIHGRELMYGCIIGYVRKRDINFWKNEIENWIDDLIQNNPNPQISWSIDDKLKIHKLNETISIFISENAKINDSKFDKITLYHIWVNLVHYF